MVKRLVVLIPLVALMSCSNDCNLNTAAGAAECACKVHDEYNKHKLNEIPDTDESEKKEEELYEEFRKIENKIIGNIKQGKYSEKEFEKELEKRGCRL